VGQAATFSVVASGRDLTYQWQKDSGSGFADIAGATSASYTTPVTTAADEGSRFRVVVSNPVSSATSSEVTLTVLVSPAISVQPGDLSVVAGTTATFGVTASGTAPLTYQWQKDSGAGFTNIAGATSASYTTPATTLADDGSRYRVVVSNVAGSVTSGVANLTVTLVAVAPAITTPPANQTVGEGQTATFSVVATGTSPLSYQWQKDGGSGFAAITGATSASYTTPATTLADDGSRYRVVVTNAVGNVTSAAATLDVNAQTTSSSGGGGGCSLRAVSKLDPVLPLVVVLTFVHLWRRRIAARCGRGF
jgi:hypothetical protein